MGEGLVIAEKGSEQIGYTDKGGVNNIPGCCVFIIGFWHGVLNISNKPVTSPFARIRLFAGLFCAKLRINNFYQSFNENIAPG